MDRSDPMTLSLASLSFTYPALPLFNNFSFSLPCGVSLIRCEESRGKSTLIRLLAGELVPDHGTIRLKQRDLIELDSKMEMSAYRNQVFFIDPRTEAFDQVSAVQFLACIESTYPGFDRQVIPQLIEGLGLATHQDKPLYMLSAGSKRKVWIAAALASHAKITLVDDLTAALDRGSIEFIVDQLIQISNQCDRHFIFSHYGTLDRVPYAAIVDI
jgi:ABC-type multidrug transport system ATPase subunit